MGVETWCDFVNEYLMNQNSLLWYNIVSFAYPELWLTNRLHEARYDIPRAHHQIDLVNVLKLAFDPKVVLNPGRLYHSFGFQYAF